MECWQQGRHLKAPTRKLECWAGAITDPHYNNTRSPVPSQMSSLVTLQWVVSAYSHIPCTEPLKLRLSHREHRLPHYHHAPERLPALIHYTHHFYLPHQNMIYMVIYFTVLYLLPPPHVLYHLSWVLHQQQWTLRPTPQSEGEQKATLSPFPPYRVSRHQPQSRHYRLSANPLPTSVFLRMLSSTNQRGRKWANYVTEIEAPTRMALEAHKSPCTMTLCYWN